MVVYDFIELSLHFARNRITYTPRWPVRMHLILKIAAKLLNGTKGQGTNKCPSEESTKWQGHLLINNSSANSLLMDSEWRSSMLWAECVCVSTRVCVRVCVGVCIYFTHIHANL